MRNVSGPTLAAIKRVALTTMDLNRFVRRKASLVRGEFGSKSAYADAGEFSGRLEHLDSDEVSGEMVAEGYAVYMLTAVDGTNLTIRDLVFDRFTGEEYEVKGKVGPEAASATKSAYYVGRSLT